jgi:predicted RNase H-like nuclease (RuvC/YqgF family)
MDVDIYGDLEFDAEGQLAPSSSELKDKVAELEAANQQLRQTVEKLTRQNGLLDKKAKILEKNISVLYATAVEESKRKDEEIAQLRAQLQSQHGPRRPSNPPKDQGHSHPHHHQGNRDQKS